MPAITLYFDINANRFVYSTTGAVFKLDFSDSDLTETTEYGELPNSGMNTVFGELMS